VTVWAFGTKGKKATGPQLGGGIAIHSGKGEMGGGEWGSLKPLKIWKLDKTTERRLGRSRAL